MKTTMDKKLNILYLSVLAPYFTQGPTYSIPAQIKAQARYDNVLWLNLVNSNAPSMRELFKEVTWKNLPYYKDLSQDNISILTQLPAPFNRPDLIIVEQFYPFGKHIGWLYQIVRSRIPFIIIPRGELTKGAQNQKKWKKKLANFLFFSSICHHAVAIQYLTDRERISSGTEWNKTGLVVPNGISLETPISRHYQSGAPIKFLYIGRLNIVHKGLDLLLNGLAQIKELLADSCTIDIYGPDLENNREKLLCMIQERGLSEWVHVHKELYKSDKIYALQQADAFIMTSRFEGHPMGLIEALAYGLPCVVTTGTNMREEIEKYNAGWTADNTAESIASALKQMLSEREQFAQKSANARHLATQYDWDKLAQQSHKIYEELLRKNQ